MGKRQGIEHRFVETIPDSLEDGILYVTVRYRTALHKCGCGCGREVVTPISPTDWQLTFDGDTVSLWPSIGNWSFPCRSHYFIERNRMKWAGDMSAEWIEMGRRRDRAAKEAYYVGRAEGTTEATGEKRVHRPPPSGLLGIKRWLRWMK